MKLRDAPIAKTRSRILDRWQPRAYFARHAQVLIGSLGRLAQHPVASLMTMAVIGVALALTEGTVKAHLKSIFAKLDVADRTHAVTTAVRRGIIEI